MFPAVSFCTDSASRVTPARQTQLFLHPANSVDRAHIERFVQHTYQRAYGAQLREFLPLLLELRCAERTEAALGMRPAAIDTALFLEHYLDLPVEQHIATCAGLPVARTDIVEIGNLAAGRRGASPVLFLIMAAALDAAGYRWLAFTATPQVEKLVARLQYRPLLLREVDPTRLGDRVQDWGSYYDTRPQVMCVHLADALRAGRDSAVIAATIDGYANVIAALANALRHGRRQSSREQRSPV